MTFLISSRRQKKGQPSDRLERRTASASEHYHHRRRRLVPSCSIAAVLLLGVVTLLVGCQIMIADNSKTSVMEFVVNPKQYIRHLSTTSSVTNDRRSVRSVSFHPLDSQFHSHVWTVEVPTVVHQTQITHDNGNINHPKPETQFNDQSATTIASVQTLRLPLDLSFDYITLPSCTLMMKTEEEIPPEPRGAAALSGLVATLEEVNTTKKCPSDCTLEDVVACRDGADEEDRCPVTVSSAIMKSNNLGVVVASSERALEMVQSVHALSDIGRMNRMELPQTLCLLTSQAAMEDHDAMTTSGRIGMSRAPHSALWEAASPKQPSQQQPVLRLCFDDENDSSVHSELLVSSEKNVAELVHDRGSTTSGAYDWWWRQQSSPLVWMRNLDHEDGYGYSVGLRQVYLGVGTGGLTAVLQRTLSLIPLRKTANGNNGRLTETGAAAPPPIMAESSASFSLPLLATTRFTTRLPYAFQTAFVTAFQDVTGIPWASVDSSNDHQISLPSTAYLDRLPTLFLQLEAHKAVGSSMRAGKAVDAIPGLIGPHWDSAHPRDVLLAIPPNHYLQSVLPSSDEPTSMTDVPFLATISFSTADEERESPDTVWLGAQALGKHDVVFDVQRGRIGLAERNQGCGAGRSSTTEESAGFIVSQALPLSPTLSPSSFPSVSTVPSSIQEDSTVESSATGHAPKGHVKASSASSNPLLNWTPHVDKTQAELLLNRPADVVMFDGEQASTSARTTGSMTLLGATPSDEELQNRVVWRPEPHPSIDGEQIWRPMSVQEQEGEVQQAAPEGEQDQTRRAQEAVTSDGKLSSEKVVGSEGTSSLASRVNDQVVGKRNNYGSETGSGVKIVYSSDSAYGEIVYPENYHKVQSRARTGSSRGSVNQADPDGTTLVIAKEEANGAAFVAMGNEESSGLPEPEVGEFPTFRFGPGAVSSSAALGVFAGASKDDEKDRGGQESYWNVIGFLLFCLSFFVVAVATHDRRDSHNRDKDYQEMMETLAATQEAASRAKAFGGFRQQFVERRGDYTLDGKSLSDHDNSFDRTRGSDASWSFAGESQPDDMLHDSTQRASGSNSDATPYYTEAFNYSSMGKSFHSEASISQAETFFDSDITDKPSSVYPHPRLDEEDDDDDSQRHSDSKSRHREGINEKDYSDRNIDGDQQSVSSRGYVSEEPLESRDGVYREDADANAFETADYDYDEQSFLQEDRSSARLSPIYSESAATEETKESFHDDKRRYYKLESPLISRIQEEDHWREEESATDDETQYYKASDDGIGDDSDYQWQESKSSAFTTRNYVKKTNNIENGFDEAEDEDDYFDEPPSDAVRHEPSQRSDFVRRDVVDDDDTRSVKSGVSWWDDSSAANRSAGTDPSATTGGSAGRSSYYTTSTESQQRQRMRERQFGTARDDPYTYASSDSQSTRSYSTGGDEASGYQPSVGSSYYGGSIGKIAEDEEESVATSVLLGRTDFSNHQREEERLRETYRPSDEETSSEDWHSIVHTDDAASFYADDRSEGRSEARSFYYERSDEKTFFSGLESNKKPSSLHASFTDQTLTTATTLSSGGSHESSRQSLSLASSKSTSARSFRSIPSRVTTTTGKSKEKSNASTR